MEAQAGLGEVLQPVREELLRPRRALSAPAKA
jgi:hypothetical protein